MLVIWMLPEVYEIWVLPEVSEIWSLPEAYGIWRMPFSILVLTSTWALFWEAFLNPLSFVFWNSASAGILM